MGKGNVMPGMTRFKKASLTPWLLLICCPGLSVLFAQSNPLDSDPFIGQFGDGQLRLELEGVEDGYSGQLSYQGKSYRVQAQRDTSVAATAIVGTFEAEGTQYPFGALLEFGKLILITGNSRYTLEAVQADSGAGIGTQSRTYQGSGLTIIQDRVEANQQQYSFNALVFIDPPLDVSGQMENNPFHLEVHEQHEDISVPGSLTFVSASKNRMGRMSQGWQLYLIGEQVSGEVIDAVNFSVLSVPQGDGMFSIPFPEVLTMNTQLTGTISDVQLELRIEGVISGNRQFITLIQAERIN